jgi:hypothetical protein
MSNLYEEQLKRDAQKRVDFRRHLSIYLVVSTLLWVIWVFSGGGYMWPIWPTGGWGIAVFFHYVGVFNPFQFFSVEKEVEKLKQEKK